MYFRANLCIFGQIKKKPRKTQGPFENRRKNPRPSEKTQEPKIASKNPRSWEKTQAVATLLTSSGLSYCSRCIFPDPRPVGLHRVGELYVTFASS